MNSLSTLKVILPVFLAAASLLVTTSLGANQGAAHAEKTGANGASADPEIIEITALHHAFRAPDEIPSGWVTYRVNNERAEEIHEVSLALLPDGKTQEDYLEEVIPVWENVWERIHTGEIDEQAEAVQLANEVLPEWNREVRYVRARGLISPARSTMNTQYLEPGNYALSCWLKSADGQLHISHGMSRPLTVTEQKSEGTAPVADVGLSISDGEIKNEGTLQRGTQTIALRMSGENAHDNVHLVRMAEDTDLAAVSSWMNWYSAGGLQAPAPAEFLGGVHTYGHRSPDNRAYFTVENVEPGRYAWLVQAPAGEKLWEIFTVE